MPNAQQSDDRERLEELNISADTLLKKLRAVSALLNEVSEKWRALPFATDDLREISEYVKPIAANLHAAVDSWNDLPGIDEVQDFANAVAEITQP